MRKECKWEMWSGIKRDLQVRQSDPKRYSDSESITCTQRHNNIWTCEEGKKAWEWFCEARKCLCLKVQFNFTRFVLEKSHFWGNLTSLHQDSGF